MMVGLAEKIRVLIWVALASNAVPAGTEELFSTLISDPEQFASLVSVLLGVGNLVWWAWDRFTKKDESK